MKKICINCNKEFSASNSSAKYCSTRCKNQYNYKIKAKVKVEEHERQEKEALYLKTKEEIEQRDQAIIDKCLKPLISSINERKKELKQEVQQLEDDYLAACKNQEKENQLRSEISKLKKSYEYFTFWAKADGELIYNCYVGAYAQKLRSFSNPRLNLHYQRLSISQLQLPGIKKAIAAKRHFFATKTRELTQLIDRYNKDLQAHTLASISHKLIIDKYSTQSKALKDKESALDKQLCDVLTLPELIKISQKVKEENIVKLEPQKPAPKPRIKTEMTAQDIMNMDYDSFQLSGELGRFLGDLERQACAITLIGDSGAGKSYFSFDLALLFDQEEYSVYYFSLEEGIGELTKKKLNGKDFSERFTISGKGKLAEVRKAAKDYDVIIIDSFGKIDAKAEDYDKLRMDFPRTIFISIFQKTTTGSVRGGSAIVFDSSAIINVQKRDEQRVAVMQKSRYGTAGWEYSITDAEIIKED